MSTETKRTSLQDAREVLAAEWSQLSPQTPEEIAEFYKNTPNYVADLDAWHSDPGRQEWSQIICAAVAASKAQVVLDIGAGAGHDLLAIRDFDSSVNLYAVEPNDSMRRELESQGIVTWNSIKRLETLSQTQVFDMITCLDVLEHIPDPEQDILEPMLKCLKPDGIFIEATATHDIDTPLHLPSLRGWSPARWLDAHGFIIEQEFYEGRLRIWHRVTGQRGTEPNLLLCAYRALTAETAMSVFNLLDNGWRRSIHRGDALVSRVRSIAVSRWYQEDAGDVFLMVDDDIVFSVEDAEKVIELARSTHGIASAAYPVRGGTHLASRVFPSDEGMVTFGPGLEPIEIEYAATGFFAVHRDVVTAMIAECDDVPLCMLNGQYWFWPLFMPFVRHYEGQGTNEYLSEDYAFCDRARSLGFKVWLDRTVELQHIGQVPFTIRTMPMAQQFDQVPTDGGL